MIPALNPQSRIRAVNSERAAESARWHRAGFSPLLASEVAPNTMLEKADRPAHRVISKSRFAKLDTNHDVIQRLMRSNEICGAGVRELANRSGARYSSSEKAGVA
jgi:hypothetical protein